MRMDRQVDALLIYGRSDDLLDQTACQLNESLFDLIIRIDRFGATKNLQACLEQGR